MTSLLSPSQISTAIEIDAEVVRLLKLDGDEALMLGMMPLMAKFKPILDTAKPGQMDMLCERFPGFKHFAQLLEAMALAIADGQFKDVLGT